jgi:carboxymethylenebutenolidase
MDMISRLLLFSLLVGFLCTLGCVYSSNSGLSDNAHFKVQNITGTASDGTGKEVLDPGKSFGLETAGCGIHIKSSTVNLASENRTYPAYIAAPAAKESSSAIVLIHSFKGFEPGYKKMVDRMAAEGYVVIAPFWQTYSTSPSDAEVESLIRSSIAYLVKTEGVKSEKLGLTGFCAGGRYTMLFLPQIKEFKTGVAWYGFPYTGGSEIQPDRPASLIGQLDAPLLIIHGTRDKVSNISDIYRYAGELDIADKYFELKVYQGEPHGFMIAESGELSESPVAQDAYKEMISYFGRTLDDHQAIKK